jgi:hypothetical protein
MYRLFGHCRRHTPCPCRLRVFHGLEISHDIVTLACGAIHFEDRQELTTWAILFLGEAAYLGYARGSLPTGPNEPLTPQARMHKPTFTHARLPRSARACVHICGLVEINQAR